MGNFLSARPHHCLHLGLKLCMCWQRKDGKGEIGRVMGFTKQHIVHHPTRKGFKVRPAAIGTCLAGCEVGQKHGAGRVQACQCRGCAIVLRHAKRAGSATILAMPLLLG